MRNLLIYILLIILKTGYGQDLQNANWIFGSGVGVTFNTSPPSDLGCIYTSPQMDAIEGCASVSDDLGNLLFFTDGMSVYKPLPNGEYETIITGLYGDWSSAQNVIIVHKPGSQTRYYIFTIKGATSGNINRGVYYSEIDISLDSPIIFLNVPLKDQNGIEINGSWGNRSEDITSVKHSDGFQYWVETFVSKSNGQGYILSYLITENGVVNQAPTSSTALTVGLNFISHIKTSNLNNIVLISSTSIYFGYFDNSNGQVTIDSDSILQTSLAAGYGIEFSESGNYIYFLDYFGLKYININSLETINTVQYPYSSFGLGCLQRGVDGEIYGITNNSSLALIENSDNPSNININSSYVSFGCYAQMGLPQLIEIQPFSLPCPELITIRKNVEPNEIEQIQASDFIFCQNTINSNATAIYHAGNSVILSNGFHSKSGSKLRAYIEGCTNIFVGRSSSQVETIRANKNSIQNTLNSANNKTKIYPNPANNSFFAENLNSIKSIEVYDINGKKIINIDFTDELQIQEIDISMLDKGFYFIKTFDYMDNVNIDKIIKK